MKRRVLSTLLASLLAMSLSFSAVPALAESAEESASAAAEQVAELIDAIYVQEWTENTEAQCAEAKAAWDALTDEEIGRAHV